MDLFVVVFVVVMCGGGGEDVGLPGLSLLLVAPMIRQTLNG
jgi:hypothetical protein